MNILLVFVALVLFFDSTRAAYSEQYRPQVHFTPAINWMNDPNGLIYYNQKYHLFYQYNPEGTKWGHMSWGHAQSTDLLHWEDLPIAILEENNIMMFSGSAIEVNKSMVLMYAGQDYNTNTQTINIATSADGVDNFKKYAGNPVIDIHSPNFRDPKVFWYEKGSYYVNAIVLSDLRKVRFYKSTDLIHWTMLSDFGPAGSIPGVYECPDLFEMKIDGSEETKWVLVLSMSGTTGYFVGDFNGTHFIIDPKIKDIIRFDYGADFYAAISFNGIPQSKPFQQRVLIGWINNWAYANDIPTSTWRGAQSFPRALTLKKDNLFGYKVWNLPVTGIDQLIQTKILAIAQKNITGEFDIDLKGYDGRTAYISAVIHLKDAKAIGVKVLKGTSEYTKVYLDASSQQLIVDRSKSGNVAFNENFLKIPNAVTYRKSVIRLKIIVDRSSVEVFDCEGGVSITSRVFPNSESSAGVSVFAEGGSGYVELLEVAPLKSIH